ncbi:uncharacterized protein LOC135114233 [Scylla paramamosain]|uniref:uncharacterized protein LOC135114233 n=1 Tax=Scylla paramamosain TaxID=85552 RepID=UPI003083D0ED
MTVDDPGRPPPRLEQETAVTVTILEVTREKVELLLREVDVRKATGPDDVRPRALKDCASELAGLLTGLHMKACLEENTCPSVWKEARVVPPVHKRSAKSNPGNYRPISLPSV